MTKTFKKVALIPARSGSKRIKDKNIYLFNNHPLMAYTIDIALKSKIFDEVYVATDSRKYADIAESYGAKVPFLRPKNISGDKSPDVDWVYFYLNKLKKQNIYFDIFSILRPTSPFRSSIMLKKAMKKFLMSKNADSLRAIEKCTQHPGKMWIQSKDKKFMHPLFPFSINGNYWHSNQYASLPDIYSQNASLEISWTRNIFHNKSISGEVIIPFETNGFEGFDINNEIDLAIAEHLFKKKVTKLRKIKHG